MLVAERPCHFSETKKKTAGLKCLFRIPRTASVHRVLKLLFDSGQVKSQDALFISLFSLTICSGIYFREVYSVICRYPGGNAHPNSTSGESAFPRQQMS